MRWRGQLRTHALAENTQKRRGLSQRRVTGPPWSEVVVQSLSCLQLWQLQHARLPCPSQFPRVRSNSASSKSVAPSNHLILGVPFSSCPQSFPASVSFPMNQLFASGGQSTGASASASVLPMNIQSRFPLGWTCLISLRSKGLSKVFSSPTIQKHQFFSTQSSLWSNSHICTWLLERALDYMDLCRQCNVSAF